MSKPAVSLELLVEPFAEGAPGPHVDAAVEALEKAGLSVDLGPFSSTTRGELADVAEAVRAMIVASIGAGATRISLQLATTGAGAVLVDDLHGALSRMVASIEQELGAPLGELPREQKQAAVRMLDERGAFLLRRAAEDIAERMGVSRITIYNYLNAIG